MNTYSVKFQIGDIIFFSKKIPIVSLTKIDIFKSEPLNSLPESDVELPQYFPQININACMATNKITVKDGKIFYIRSIYNNHFINLGDYKSFDEYLMKFSSKSRATLKRKVRKAEGVDFSYKIYQQADDVEEFHLHACTVGEHTYQKRLFDSSIPNDDNYKMQMYKLAEKGNFLGLILFKDGKACAYLYLPIIDNQYVYAYLGYLPEYAKFSPGTVLQFYAFQHIFHEDLKATYFNFTEGDGQHKEFFSTDKKLCCNCLVLENSIFNRLLLKLQVANDCFSEYLGRILDKYNVRAKIKKLIRKQ